MKETVENNELKPPTWWLDKGIELSSLWIDLKNELTKYEMLYKSEVVDYIEQDKKISEAKLLVEAKSENYKMYSYLKGRDLAVKEFIMIAKARSKVESTYEY